MAERSTIARPYAQAAFELARDLKALKEWSDMLQLVAAVASDDDMRAFVASPQVDRERLAQAFIDICGDQLDAGGQNFVRVVADNQRLDFLPEIAALYEQLRADAEGSVDAEVITAYPLSDDQQQALAAALSKRLQRKVNLTCKVDETVLGGAIVRAGDLVIDGTAVGKLNRLATALLH
ncbi:MAG: ATP synthase F0F1 subunit delta [Thiotrichales bacterium SG8_50]|nr:MAG: ATP synthase F0F1 subunit delta [Thiotrichales bacterium SG8_50]